MDFIHFTVHHFQLKIKFFQLKHQENLIEFLKNLELNKFINIKFENKAISNYDNQDITLMKVKMIGKALKFIVSLT